MSETPNGHAKNPEWLDKVEAEAMQYVAAVQHNFQHGLQVAMALVPPPKDKEADKEQRATVLDTFLEATFGLAAQFVAETFHAGPKAEEQAVALLRDKFAHIREMKAAAQAADPRPKTLGPTGVVPLT